LGDWSSDVCSSDLKSKMNQKNTRFKYSQTEARLNKESDQEPLYTYRTS
jgi:hypothetical protein